MTSAVVSRSGLAFLVAALVTAPFAQVGLKPEALLKYTGEKARQVAKLHQVEGSVLVSQGSGLATAADATPLEEGSRVLTTANSSALLIFNDGCVIKVNPNERVEVGSESPCQVRAAQPTSIFAASPPPAPFLDPNLLALVVTGVSIVTGITAIVITKPDAASPS